MHEKLARLWDSISLRTKITGVTVLLLTAGLVVAGFGTMAVLRSYLLEQVDRQLTTGLESLGLADGFNLKDAEDYVTTGSSPLNPYYIAIVDDEGILLGANLNAEDGRGPALERYDVSATESGARFLTVAGQRNPTQWRLLLTPVIVAETGEPATLLIGAELSETDATVARFGAVFLFFALTVIILGGALTRILATTTFLPLRRLEDTAARFADGDYSQRMTDAAPPNTEVGRLSRSLNVMLTRIDSALADRSRTIEQMRRFVGDASHELRTPLVTVRGYAELYRMGALTSTEDVDQAMERIEKEAVRMAGLVEDLLTLARLDAITSSTAEAQWGAGSGGVKPMEFTRVDLLPLAQDAARDAMASYPSRTVTVVGLDEELLREPIREARPADAQGRATGEQPAITGAVPTISASAANTGPTAAGAAEPDTLTKPITLPADAQTTTPRRGVTLATGPIVGIARFLSRRPAAPKAPIVVEPELPPPPPDLDAIVMGEEDRLRQIIANLVSNALRYTPEGTPLEIGVGIDGDNRRAVLAVIDHGDGIPPSTRDKIFQRFWRADTSRTRETGGNGLGLAIVAAIVAAHNGSVDVVDTPGGGATFRVWFPLAS